MRDTLFGDAPQSEWPRAGSESGEPWATFHRARLASRAGWSQEAVAIWKGIVETPGLESRHYLQAWTFLREAGAPPDASEAKQLLGVVVEVPMRDGLDLLAAYADHHARYWNYTGSGVVWEHPDTSLDGEIGALLQAGKRVLDQIGPWDGPRPPPPTGDQARLNFLAPGGLYFGQASFAQLHKDTLAGPVINAALDLMARMTVLPPGATKPR